MFDDNLVTVSDTGKELGEFSVTVEPTKFKDEEPPKPEFEKKPLNWEEDMEMYSKFLDRKVSTGCMYVDLDCSTGCMYLDLDCSTGCMYIDLDCSMGCMYMDLDCRTGCMYNQQCPCRVFHPEIRN
nr:hypothetical protein BaRGS_018378 [Batillaria attramentaria]